MKSLFPDARVLAVLIFVFAALTQVERGVCYARQLGMPWSSGHIQYAGLYFLMAYWLYRDDQEKWMWRVWDMGFFLWIAWPVIIPYYLIKTRGIKRASLIFLFLAITCFAVFEIAASVCRAMQ